MKVCARKPQALTLAEFPSWEGAGVGLPSSNS